jgi:hypothetical protein
VTEKKTSLLTGAGRGMGTDMAKAGQGGDPAKLAIELAAAGNRR